MLSNMYYEWVLESGNHIKTIQEQYWNVLETIWNQFENSMQLLWKCSAAVLKSL